MNYKKIMERLQEHLDSALAAYGQPDWFVICLQGSQNYGIADEESDIDSKLLIFPTFEDLVFNKQAVSHTHIMDNDEHCDVKDIREYFKIFRKQNINFVEILFTDWYIVNPKYKDEWFFLIGHREEIARYNEYQALKCMLGMASEKYHALTHKYPSRTQWIDKFGYDPKQASHLLRVRNFIKDYIDNEKSYKEMLIAPEECMKIKRNGFENGNAIDICEKWYNECRDMVNKWTAEREPQVNEKANDYLNNTLYSAMKKSIFDSAI